MYETKRECIIPSDEEFTFKCGTNMRAYASSRKQMIDNDPCNPGLEKPKAFEWNPGDKRMWVTYTFNSPFVMFKNIELEWKYQPASFVVECYSDRP